ncbi:hypothetical protein [Polyangium aurulentum]|uniref:hypothetical protein n=1 Tax=Polyangium aurulentum TaxID=2567896 RepID=UPI0010AECE5C|nr:hypothetical protein [Polyangium aurulentum]UQA61763.1 hypothetical protein E8A73_015345 [Polyangium aurulentum]
MQGPIDSKIDASVLNAMRAWRRQTEGRAEEKLALLRRLRRQYETKSLPKYTETQVEQSFNEQIFARVFDYQTLLSDDGTSTHHIQPKEYVKGTGRTPDIVIGTFAAGTGAVLASAELKSPEAPLDQPQGGNYNGLTPVQQAFQAVKGEQACRWVLVCNYNELRLYQRVDLVNDDDQPPPYLVRAKLADIRNKNDLAKLCAHFDRRALLGTSISTTGEPRSELMAALERHHPAMPIEEQDGHVRAVLLFTPRVDEDFALFRLERRLREALANNRHWLGLLCATGGSPAPRFELAEGFISAIGKDASGNDVCKVNFSGLGQLQVSALRKRDAKGAIDTGWLVDVVRFFVTLVDDVYHGLSEATQPGRVSPELRDVKDVVLEAAPEHRDAAMSSSGKAGTPDVRGVDFAYTPVLDKGEPLVADVVSELAIYFRSQDGKGGVGIDREALLREIK